VFLTTLLVGMMFPLTMGCASTNVLPLQPFPVSSPAPLDTLVIKDPSGTYSFRYLGNGQYSTDIATYQAILQDPYTKVVSSEIETTGNTVLITTPSPLVTSYPTFSGSGWSGAGGGFCTFSSGTYGIICGSPQYTLNISQVYIASLSWNSTCLTGTSCVTSFWTGLSNNDTGGSSSELIQNGMHVCYNLGACPNGGSSGLLTWNMFWNELPPYSQNDQIIAGAPTSISSVVHEFEIYWTGTNTANFYWAVGTWTANLQITTNATQTDFVQSEGILESPTTGNGHYPIVPWSSDPAVLTGWYRAAGWWSNASTGNIGSGYPLALFNLTYGGTVEAYGTANPQNSYTYLGNY